MPEPTTFDFAMMSRCIAISEGAMGAPELPFAALITRDREVIAETLNRAARDHDVSRHAELVVLSEAQRVLGTKNLSGCCLYTTVEPCIMCSFPIRETRISRIVFALKSRLMGGYSRWGVLVDENLSIRMPEYFGSPPEILADVLRIEAEDIWRRWNPEIWARFQGPGMFGGEDKLPEATS